MGAAVALSVQESSRLAYCESLITRGIATFYQVGTALLQIRDERLYRGTHKTFEQYCRDKWQMSRPRAYQLIEAAEIVENLSTNVDKIHEGQIRPLARLEPEQQREVWQQAVHESPDGHPTAEKVRALSLTTLIRQRMEERAEADERSAPQPSAAEKRERAELREEMKRNSEFNAQVYTVIDALVVLAHPSLAISLLAKEIYQRDTPDDDYCAQSRHALRHLEELVRELPAHAAPWEPILKRKEASR